MKSAASRPLGIVAALAAEAHALGRLTPQGPARRLADGTLVSISGIGADAARRAALDLAEQGAGALLSWGFAGGLDPSLTAGSIVLPAFVVSPLGARMAVASAWHARLTASLAAPGLRLSRGDLLTNPVALDSVADKAEAFRRSGAVAVDMESIAIGEAAAARALPFAAVRVIVDTAADSLPRAVTAASRAGRVALARLFWELARAPGDLAALLRLAARYRAALRTLTAAAAAGRSALAVDAPYPA